MIVNEELAVAATISAHEDLIVLLIRHLGLNFSEEQDACLKAALLAKSSPAAGDVLDSEIELTDDIAGLMVAHQEAKRRIVTRALTYDSVRPDLRSALGSPAGIIAN